MRRLALYLLLFAAPALAQVAHPRIWLDSATMTVLQAKVAANDADWLALKAQADALKLATVKPYSRNTDCEQYTPLTEICYVYQGGGWYEPAMTLALAYRMTGDTAYSNKLKELMVVMESTNGNTSPIFADTGYPTRFVLPAFAFAFDAVYDQLNSTEKANAASLANYWWGLWQSSPGSFYDKNGAYYAWGDGSVSNYATGHLVGFGMLGLALEGESGFDGAAVNTAMKSYFDTHFAPSVQSGFSAGGYLWQGYNYAPNSVHWIMEYLWARKTANKGDEFAGFDYITPYIKRGLYDRQPNNWRAYSEGEFPGTTSFVMPNNLAIEGTTLGNSTTAGWAQKFLADAAVYPGGSAVFMPPAWERFLMWTKSAAVDYTATLPLNAWFPGDYHTITRSDWTTNAVWAAFNGGGAWTTDHQNRSWGNIELVRGADVLMTSPFQWRNGAQGVTGSYLTGQFTIGGWQSNSLFVNDGGVYCLDQSNINYLGCQMFYATENQNSSQPSNYAAPVHKETAAFAYSKQNFVPGYDLGSWSRNATNRSVQTYTRSFLAVGGRVFFVFDRVAVKSATFDWRLLWWMNPYATAVSTSSNAMQATVGSSKIWGKVLLPTDGTVTQTTGLSAFSSGSTVAQRFDVRAATGSAGDNFLTVWAPTASSVGSMPTTTLIDGTTFKGALYDDGAPEVAMFSADGTRQMGALYSVSYSGTGSHIIADLAYGAYDITVNGVTIATGVPVGLNDGVLTFTSTSGTVLIARTGFPVYVVTCNTVGSGTCSGAGAYTGGDAATLTASPSAGYSFAGWSGGCTGVGSCSFTVTGNTTVTANFTPIPGAHSTLLNGIKMSGVVVR